MPSIRKKKAQRPKRAGMLAAGLAAGSGAALFLGRRVRARQNAQQ